MFKTPILSYNPRTLRVIIAKVNDKNDKKSSYIKKSILLKHKDKYLNHIKTWKLPHAKISLYQKRSDFKLKHTNVIVIIPTKLEKRATRRNKLKRYIKNQFAPILREDLVFIVRFF